MNRRSMFTAVGAGLLAIFGAVGAAAQDYPSRPITLIVPYSAGGGVDIYARALAANVGDSIPVPIAVVNRPGAGGLTGAQAVINSRPDGYTLKLTSGGSFLLATLMTQTQIDAVDSFDFIAQIGNLNTALVVSADSPYRTVEDLVDAARASERPFRWSHSGRGTFHNVAGMGFLSANGIEAQDIPFDGGSPARAAILGGQVDFGFIGIQQTVGFENELRPLAVNAAERDAISSSIPSFAELGIPYTNVSSPILLMAPKGTPGEVIAYLETAMSGLTESETFAEMLAAAGNAPVYRNADDARANMVEMREQVLPLIAELTEE